MNIQKKLKIKTGRKGGREQQAQKNYEASKSNNYRLSFPRQLNPCLTGLWLSSVFKKLVSKILPAHFFRGMMLLLLSKSHIGSNTRMLGEP